MAWPGPVTMAVLAAVATAGCGADDGGPSPLCLGAKDPIARALQAAPGRVALARRHDALELRRAARPTPSDLQTFGTLATSVAEDLEERAPPTPPRRCSSGTSSARRGAAPRGRTAWRWSWPAGSSAARRSTASRPR